MSTDADDVDPSTFGDLADDGADLRCPDVQTHNQITYLCHDSPCLRDEGRISVERRVPKPRLYAIRVLCAVGPQDLRL